MKSFAYSHNSIKIKKLIQITADVALRFIRTRAGVHIPLPCRVIYLTLFTGDRFNEYEPERERQEVTHSQTGKQTLRMPCLPN